MFSALRRIGTGCPGLLTSSGFTLFCGLGFKVKLARDGVNSKVAYALTEHLFQVLQPFSFGFLGYLISKVSHPL